MSVADYCNIQAKQHYAGYNCHQ